MIPDAFLAPVMDMEKSYRILVVDDNTAIHDDFKKILGADPSATKLDDHEAALFGGPTRAAPRTRFNLSFASQGQEALALMQKAHQVGERYSVVFMDVRMPPGWDGIETAVKLWEVDPDLQIVICTAYSDKSWEEMMEEIPHPERLLILKKPFDTIEVLQLAHALPCSSTAPLRRVPLSTKQMKPKMLILFGNIILRRTIK